MVDRVGKDIGRSIRWGIMQNLSRTGITVKTGAKAHAITDTGIIIDKDGVQKEIAADTIVLAAGSNPFNRLQPVLEALKIPFEKAGDAVDMARAFDAVHQGFAAGRRI